MTVFKVAQACFVLSLTAQAATPRAFRFEPNVGQTGSEVAFVARGPNQTLFLTSGGATLRHESAVLKMYFAGANPAAEVVGLDPLESRVHYLIGVPEEWHTDVPTYARVQYRNIYPGVDLIYYDNHGILEYDLVLKPGAAASDIRLRFEGTDVIRPDADGDVVLRTPVGEWRHSTPEVYQLRNGHRAKVGGRFRALAADEIGFDIEDYDRSRPLVIDPSLVFSTYLGGSGDGAATSIALDAAANTYVTGWTVSTDFPARAGTQLGNPSGVDAYVAKLSPEGELLYITYVGGADDDRGYGIAVDNSGLAVIAGWTYSGNFPIVNGTQPGIGGGRDGFVAKLNTAGNGLIFSTYCGGSGSDSSNAVALGGQGDIYVAGETASTNFPVLNGLQTQIGGGQDAFIAKFTSAGARSYSTFLGGTGDDRATAIAVDGFGQAFVTGSTYSSNFPVIGAFQSTLAGGQDAFAAKVGSGGNTLLYSTYLGGGGGGAGAPETGNGIAIDSSGYAYIAGATSSLNFPTFNAMKSSLSGSEDAFVLKLSVSGSALVYSTYLGGSSVDLATAIAVDSTGRTYVAGYTASSDFAVARAVQPSKGGSYDGFVARLNGAGSVLEMGTFIGGAGSDSAYGIALDAIGDIYVIGQTLSQNFPTVNASQAYEAGPSSAFVEKIGDHVLGCVDLAADANGHTTIAKGGTLYVGGWAADTGTGAPVQSVTIFIDSKSVGTASLGISRPDVAQAYGNNMYVASGWTFQSSTSSLNAGTHTVAVTVAGPSGTAQLGSKTFIVAQTVGFVDSATDGNGNATIVKGGVLFVGGWAADTAAGAPVQSVNIFVDGIGLGTATLGISRPDVAQAYGSMCLPSGWTSQVSTSSLSIGTHTVTAAAAGPSGTAQLSGSRTVTIKAGQEIGFLDSAGDANGKATIAKGGTLYVSGWAADTGTGAPVQSVTIFVDGKSVGTASLGISRPDVAQANGSKYLASGWTSQKSTASLSTGAHTVTATATGPSGTAQLAGSRTVTIIAGQ